jgi:protein TonB
MRQALLVSLVLHALGFAIVAAAVRPRFTVPPRLQAIPVDFIAMAAPAPALTERARPTPARSPALTERTRTVPAKPVESVPDPLQPRPRREPPRRNPPREEPRPAEPKREEPKSKPEPKPQPDLLRQGSADTTQVMRSELPRVGDLRGAMQMRVDGEVLPYAYYLSIVQRKIAGFWEPPAGIDQQPGEVAAIVWFRIEKDGAVRSNSVEEPSGISPFDASALRALTRALPLPPLPQNYPGDHLIIHLRFVYSHEASAPAEAR